MCLSSYQSSINHTKQAGFMNKGVQRLHMQIIETLEQRILDGYYKVGEQFPTENQLSLEFDVSRGTVRKALQILENQGVLSRAAGKGTFMNITGATRAVKFESANLIGLAIPHRNDQLSSNIINGAERAIRAAGYGMVFTNLENHIDTEKEQVKRLKGQPVAGIILFPLAAVGEADMLCGLLGSTPMVLVDRELPGFCGSVVMADHYQGAYLAVKHLIDLGHRKIVVVSHTSQASSVSERIRGYEQAMRDANLLPYSPVIVLDTEDHPVGQYPPIYSLDELRWIEHMLSVSDRPDAVFCVNDYTAINVMRLILSKGLRIPEDIALVSFDNSEFAQLTPVPLSSVEQNAVEMGARAAELLLRRIANPLEKDQKVLLPTRLIVRESTVGAQNDEGPDD
jgi:GntR family transcriptional regulator, arabinose operon transcriptional repressor